MQVDNRIDRSNAALQQQIIETLRKRGIKQGEADFNQAFNELSRGRVAVPSSVPSTTKSGRSVTTTSASTSASDGQAQTPTSLTVNYNGRSFTVTDPALLAQIQDAAARGDFATVANLLGPAVVQPDYGSGPNFTLTDPFFPDIPVYLPGNPTQENDGTTFENASGTTTTGEGGNDYTLSFDHESFISDFSGTFADSVHYDVTLDFTYAAPVVPATAEEVAAGLSNLTATDVTAEQAAFLLKVYGGPEGAELSSEAFYQALQADGVLSTPVTEGLPVLTLDFGAIDGQKLADAIFAAGGGGADGELTEAELQAGLGVLIGDPAGVPDGLAADIIDAAGTDGVITTAQLATFLNTGAVSFDAVEGGAVAITTTGSGAPATTFDFAGRTIEASSNPFSGTADFTTDELDLLDGLDWQAFAATIKPGDDAATVAAKFETFVAANIDSIPGTLLGDNVYTDPSSVDVAALTEKLLALDISATTADGGVVASGGEGGVFGFLLDDTLTSTTRGTLNAGERGDAVEDLFSFLSTGIAPEPEYTNYAAKVDTGGVSSTLSFAAPTESDAVWAAVEQIVPDIWAKVEGTPAAEGGPRVDVTQNDDGTYSVVVRTQSGQIVGDADFSLTETSTGRRGLREVDGNVDGTMPSEVALDAQAEAVFALAHSLVDLTDGIVPADWTREEYVAYTFGVNGVGDLAGTEEWDQFVAANLTGPNGPLDPADMDFSMFDPLLQDGSAGLETLVADGLALHDTFKALEAQGTTTFSNDTFEAAYHTVALPERRHLIDAGMTYRGAPKLKVPSFAQSESSNAVRFGTKAGNAAEIGESAGAAEAGVAAEAGAAGAGEVVVGATEAPLLIFGGVILFADWFANKFLKPTLGPTHSERPVRQPGEGVTTHANTYQAAYVAEATRTLLHSGDVVGAVDFLLQQEGQGVDVSVLGTVLDGLPTAARDDVVAELTTRVGGTDYFTALQNGRDYSALEDKAFDLSPDHTSALEGLLAPPPSASGTTALTGIGVARRLQSLPDTTAARLVSQWIGQIDSGALTDVDQFALALSTLQTETPAKYAAIASGVNDLAPGSFADAIGLLADTSQAHVAAPLLATLSLPDQARALAAAGGVEISELRTLIGAPDGIIGEIFVSMTPEAQTALATYLDGLALAQSHIEAFSALETPEERAAYLENLVVTEPLLPGVTAEEVKIHAQTQLLLSVSAEEAGLILVNTSEATALALLPAVLAEIDTSTVVGEEYFQDLIESLGTTISGNKHSRDEDGDGAGGSGGTDGIVDGGGGTGGEAPGDGGSAGGGSGTPPGGNNPNNPNGTITEVTEEQQELAQVLIEQILELLVSNPETTPEEIATFFDGLRGSGAFTPEFEARLAQNVDLMQRTAAFALGNEDTTPDQFIAIFAGLNDVDPEFIERAIATQDFPPEMDFENLIQIVTHDQTINGNDESILFLPTNILNGLARNPSLTEGHITNIISAFSEAEEAYPLGDAMDNEAIRVIRERLTDFIAGAQMNGRISDDFLEEIIVGFLSASEGETSSLILGGLIDEGIITAERALEIIGSDPDSMAMADGTDLLFGRGAALRSLFNNGHISFDQLVTALEETLSSGIEDGVDAPDDGTTDIITDLYLAGSITFDQLLTGLQRMIATSVAGGDEGLQGEFTLLIQQWQTEGRIDLSQTLALLYSLPNPPDQETLDIVTRTLSLYPATLQETVDLLAQSSAEGALHLLSFLVSTDRITLDEATPIVEKLFQNGRLSFDQLAVYYSGYASDASDRRDSFIPDTQEQGIEEGEAILSSLLRLVGRGEITAAQAVLVVFDETDFTEAEFNSLIDRLLNVHFTDGATVGATDEVEFVFELARTDFDLADRLISYLETSGRLSSEEAATLRDEVNNR